MWCVGSGGRQPNIRCRIVSASRIEGVSGHYAVATAPDDHFAAAPNCGVRIAARRSTRGCRGDPGVGSGRISGARIDGRGVVIATPDNHLGASPDRCMRRSRCRCINRRGSCPTVRRGIVPATRISKDVSHTSPHDHFCAGPNSGVIPTGRGRVRGRSGSPTVRAGIVSAARIEIIGSVASTPNNHFSSSPNRTMAVAA